MYLIATISISELTMLPTTQEVVEAYERALMERLPRAIRTAGEKQAGQIDWDKVAIGVAAVDWLEDGCLVHVESNIDSEDPGVDAEQIVRTALAETSLDDVRPREVVVLMNPDIALGEHLDDNQAQRLTQLVQDKLAPLGVIVSMDKTRSTTTGFIRVPSMREATDIAEIVRDLFLDGEISIEQAISGRS